MVSLQRIELALLVLATFSSRVTGTTATFERQIAAEAERLKQVVPEGDRQGPMKDQIEPALEALDKVAADIASGRPYRAFERLFSSFDMLESAAFWYQHAAAAKEQAPFLVLWEEVGPELEREHERLSKTTFEGAPAAVRARAEIAVSRILTHYRAARLYGKAGQLEGGLYYLGSARASLEFAKFCARLEYDPPGSPPRFRDVNEAERSLSKLTLEAYGQKDASTAHHRDFIVLDSALKEARGLLSGGRLDGAVAELLDARLRLGLARDPADGAPSPDSVPYRERLFEPGRDHTIARVHWERALEAQASADEAERRRASVILDEVIPFYFDLLQEE
jgi:hypothetical protein